ncbi:HAD-IB family hydrolase [Helicobacter sp. 23-1045]
MKILAIFDFCETLVPFQSVPPFLNIIKSQNPHYKGRFRAFRRRFFSRIYRRVPLKIFDYKNAQFEELRGFSEEIAQNLAKDYAKYLLTHTNKKVIDRLQWHKAQNHCIAIVSGGLEIYIKYFAEFFEIQNIIALELEAQNGVLSGDIKGIHTMHYRKLYKLAKMLDLSKFDLQKSFVYSDCPSDIPLFSLVGNRVAIECGKDMKWAEILKYEIL